MANVTTGYHLKFDGTGTVSGDCYVLSVQWTSDAASGDDIAADDDMVIQENGDGPNEKEQVWAKRAEFAGDDFEASYPYPGKYLNGINVATLDGGIVRIQLANSK